MHGITRIDGPCSFCQTDGEWDGIYLSDTGPNRIDVLYRPSHLAAVFPWNVNQIPERIGFAEGLLAKEGIQTVLTCPDCMRNALRPLGQNTLHRLAWQAGLLTTPSVDREINADCEDAFALALLDSALSVNGTASEVIPRLMWAAEICQKLLHAAIEHFYSVRSLVEVSTEAQKLLLAAVAHTGQPNYADTFMGSAKLAFYTNGAMQSNDGYFYIQTQRDETRCWLQLTEQKPYQTEAGMWARELIEVELKHTVGPAFPDKLWSLDNTRLWVPQDEYARVFVESEPEPVHVSGEGLYRMQGNYFLVHPGEDPSYKCLRPLVLQDVKTKDSQMFYLEIQKCTLRSSLTGDRLGQDQTFWIPLIQSRWTTFDIDTEQVQLIDA